MNETETKKHYCGECARYHKKDCSNLFPHRVKELAGACGRFLHPFDKDEFYCYGAKQIPSEPGSALFQWCPIKDRCMRFKDVRQLDYTHTILGNPGECMDHGYPHYIRKS